MRLIDGNELKKGIEQQFCTACSSEYPNPRCGACDVGEFLRYIDDAPTIEAEPAKWISVEGRLPEKEAYVLVWYEYFRYGDYNCLYQTYGIAAYYERYGWHGDDLNGDSVKVLYWQPLPEPPERSGET